MTAALEGFEWSAARLGRTLPPGMTRYPFYRRLGGPQGRSGRAENLVSTGIRFRTVQPVVSRYTDWATGPTKTMFYTPNNSVRKEWFVWSNGGKKLKYWKKCEIEDGKEKLKVQGIEETEKRNVTRNMNRVKFFLVSPS